MEHWALNFFEKITLKHVWILLGTLLGIFGILKKKFRKFSKTRHSIENWAKIFRKNCPKLQSKHVWILLGTILGVFGILKFFFDFFEIFLRFETPWKTGQKIFGKFAPKHVQNTFGYLSERFLEF